MTTATEATDLRYLRRAIELASRAAQRGNGPFGAVLVSPDGTVLAETENEGRTQGDYLAHAEMLALRSTAQQLGLDALAGATLYASAEPCAMCSGAILYVGVSRLVFGLGLARQGELRISATRRRQVPCREILGIVSGIEVVGPLLEREAEVPWELSRRNPSSGCSPGRRPPVPHGS